MSASAVPSSRVRRSRMAVSTAAVVLVLDLLQQGNGLRQFGGSVPASARRCVCSVPVALLQQIRRRGRPGRRHRHPRAPDPRGGLRRGRHALPHRRRRLARAARALPLRSRTRSGRFEMYGLAENAAADLADARDEADASEGRLNSRYGGARRGVGLQLCEGRCWLWPRVPRSDGPTGAGRPAAAAEDPRVVFHPDDRDTLRNSAVGAGRSCSPASPDIGSTAPAVSLTRQSPRMMANRRLNNPSVIPSAPSEPVRRTMVRRSQGPQDQLPWRFC